MITRSAPITQIHEPSPLALALAERAKNRTLTFFSASDFCNPKREIEGRIAVWVGTKEEEANGLRKAAAFLKKVGGGEVLSESLVQDVRTAFVMHELVRDGESEEAARKHTAFSSAEQMMSYMTSDELSKLLALVNAVQASETPWPETFDETSFGALVGAVAASDDENAAMLCARVERSFLEACFVEAVRRLTASEPAATEPTTSESEG